MLWPGLEHLGTSWKKTLVSGQRECGGWVSPASAFLLLGFPPEGVVEKSEILGAVFPLGKNAA